MFLAPIWMTSTSLKSSMSLKSISSVTIGSPVSRFAVRSMSMPGLPSPWNAYGEVRGLKAPPRSIVAPDALTAFATASPAITEKFPPPTFTPEQSMIVSSGWNFRFAALNGSWMRWTDSTPSSASRIPGSRWLTSPTQPTIVCSDPRETCGWMFFDSRSARSPLTCDSAASFLRIMMNCLI